MSQTVTVYHCFCPLFLSSFTLSDSFYLIVQKALLTKCTQGASVLQIEYQLCTTEFTEASFIFELSDVYYF